jgi:hypothetical protein
MNGEGMKKSLNPRSLGQVSSALPQHYKFVKKNAELIQTNSLIYKWSAIQFSH